LEKKRTTKNTQVLDHIRSFNTEDGERERERTEDRRSRKPLLNLNQNIGKENCITFQGMEC